MNIPKCANGYNLLFNDWAEKDLVNLIRHYRNNPSIMFWCIGNEVPNQGDKEGYSIAQWLKDICHREDPTRPVTQGMDNPDAVVENGFAAVMDVAGFNYRPYATCAIQRLAAEIDPRQRDGLDGQLPRCL